MRTREQAQQALVKLAQDYEAGTNPADLLDQINALIIDGADLNEREAKLEVAPGLLFYHGSLVQRDGLASKLLDLGASPRAAQLPPTKAENAKLQAMWDAGGMAWQATWRDYTDSDPLLESWGHTFNPDYSMAEIKNIGHENMLNLVVKRAEEEKEREAERERRVAFLMGLHSRLGADSSVRKHLRNPDLFDYNLLEKVFEYSGPTQRFPKKKKLKSARPEDKVEDKEEEKPIPPLPLKPQRYFFSLGAYLLSVFTEPALPPPPYVYGFLYGVNDQRDQPSHADQRQGAVSPWKDIYKDLADSKKPYKSIYHFFRDLLQPFIGVFYITVSAFYLASLLIGSVACLLGALISPQTIKQSDFLRFADSWLLHMAALFVRGIEQIITSPLNYLIRIPLRLFKTATQEKSDLKDSKAIQRFVQLGDRAIQHKDKPGASFEMKMVYLGLHQKFQKKHARGEHHKVDPVREEKLFLKLNQATVWQPATPAQKNEALTATQVQEAKEYLSLFRK